MNSASIKDAPPDQFRVGEVWESPKGQIYTVYAITPGRPKMATLRLGVNNPLGKKVVRPWDAVIANGQFWVRESTPEAKEVYTPEWFDQLEATSKAEHEALLAEFPPGTISEERTDAHQIMEVARICANWMRLMNHKELRHVGPFLSYPFGPFGEPFRMPRRIRMATGMVHAGTKIRSLHPTSGGILTAQRDRRISIHEINSGYIKWDERETVSAIVQPTAMWSGSGGYWNYVDLNDVELFI